LHDACLLGQPSWGIKNAGSDSLHWAQALPPIITTRTCEKECDTRWRATPSPRTMRYKAYGGTIKTITGLHMFFSIDYIQAWLIFKVPFCCLSFFDLQLSPSPLSVLNAHSWHDIDILPTLTSLSKCSSHHVRWQLFGVFHHFRVNLSCPRARLHFELENMERAICEVVVMAKKGPRA